MNYFFRLRFLLTITVLLTASSLVLCQGFLKVDGQKIINEDGGNVLLRGMGLGGWMLQEGYMLGLQGGGQQHVIKQRMADLIGVEPTEAFYQLWLKNHTRKIDIDSLKAWGFNSVRLPMHYNLYTLPAHLEPEPGKNTWLDKGFAMTDSLLAWCKANELYLILDLHAAPGGQGNDVNISDRDSSKPYLWESEDNQKKTVALWRKLAERYANEPWIAAYDILNEPNYGFQDPKGDPNGLQEKKNEPLWKLYKEITTAIREVDKTHIIIIEGNGWGNNYNGMPVLWDDNIVMSFHKYWNYNDEASIAHMIAARKERNVPVWLGETGENSNVWFTSCIALLERHNIGWAMWPLKKLGSNNPLQVRRNPGYASVLDYWKGNGPQPDKDDATRAILQLANDLKLENNIFHPDVVDAMIRQPHSTEARPFATHTTGVDIAAGDYDLGRNGYAYYDLDSANYWVIKGPQGGNKGHIYRNDGVDIKADSLQAGSHFIFNTEPGEWLQYTIVIEEAKTYSVSLTTRTKKTGQQIAVSANGGRGKKVDLKKSNEAEWSSSRISIPLKKGTNRIRIHFTHGGVELKTLRIDK